MNHSTIRALVFALPVVLVACNRAAVEPHAHEEAESWAVTAWSDAFEVFPECDPLVAGQTSTCHTHVTVLETFAAMKEGSVSAVLRAQGGAEEVFTSEKPLRDGIWNVEIRPAAPGSYGLLFRIDSPSGTGDVQAGTIEVGSLDKPGGLVEPAIKVPEVAGSDDASSFLKEQQWRTPFHTDWVREGSMRESVRGLAKVRPVAGGEVVVAAPQRAVVQRDPWPHVGMPVAPGATLMTLTSNVSTDRSLADIRASSQEARSELETAQARLGRLEKLLPLEAASPAEVEAARAEVSRLGARSEANARDLASAEAARTAGDGGGERILVTAPFAGHVAEVRATPGQGVDAGEALARVVATDPVWMEVALRPQHAARLASDPAGLLVRAPGEADAMPVEGATYVSRAPEVDPSNGSVTVILQAPNPAGTLLIGTALEADVLLGQERQGVVIPSESVVDDSGVSIAYVQLEGESFARRELQVIARLGDRVMVEGLLVGERLVTRGGAAIRRATLVSSGAGEGHVH